MRVNIVIKYGYLFLPVYTLIPGKINSNILYLFHPFYRLFFWLYIQPFLLFLLLFWGHNQQCSGITPDFTLKDYVCQYSGHQIK